MRKEKIEAGSEHDNANTAGYTNATNPDKSLTASNLFNYLMYVVHKRKFKRKLDDVRKVLGEQRFRECFYGRKKLMVKELEKLRKKDI